jgi:PKD repeat protein
VSGQVPYLNVAGWTDVTTGSNGSCTPLYLCKGAAGYDGPTGLGTPLGVAGFAGSGGSGGGGGGTPNQPPTASFTPACTNLSCSFTDSSSDGDGSIKSWSWAFGDGTTSALASPTHNYGATGSYTVTLTVTDNLGAKGSTSQTVTVTKPFTLTVTGSVSGGRDTARLTWSGAAGHVDIYRTPSPTSPYKSNVSGSAFTDRTNVRGAATFTYWVCNTGTTTCSNQATVKF